MIDGVRILFLEDDILDFELVSSRLAEAGLHCKVDHAKNQSAFEKAISTEDYHLILSDYSIPGYSGMAALRHVRSKSPTLPFIILSGTLSEEQAVEILRAGATDYIIKQRLNRLAPAVERALEEAAQKEELRENEQRVREQAALLDKARDAIVLLDMEQRILFWNKSAERIFGWTSEEVIGEHIGVFLTGRSSASFGSVLDQALSREEWRGELPVQTKTGKRIIVESRWSVMRDSESTEPKGVLLINTDITEKKEIEAQFLRAQRIETIGSLSGGIAHDLNNALSPIIMASELLNDEITTDSGHRMIEMVRGSAKRCADMVKQILTFSRGAGQAWELLDMCKIIDELAGLARETFPRLITIQTRCDSNLSGVVGNLTQIHQVLMNLLVNARDAMPRGGEIQIRARNVTLKKRASKMLTRSANGPFLSIAVTDTGTGIAPEIVDRIFEPFFTTKELGKGTGLGLSTVLSIVKAHGGFLELQSDLGKGTTFELFFPAEVEASKVIEEPIDPPPQRAAGEQLLIVDDEAGLLAIVKNTLETFGYRVRTASDGLAALDILEKSRGEIDLVLTDWIMPLMSGTELLRRIRAISPDIKVIVVTGSAQLEHGELRDLSIQGVLEKPYNTETLLARVREVFDGVEPLRHAPPTGPKAGNAT
jgi:two-component system, cell cycle sensor histidine kinase and response regulator CckA